MHSCRALPYVQVARRMAASQGTLDSSSKYSDY